MNDAMVLYAIATLYDELSNKDEDLEKAIRQALYKIPDAYQNPKTWKKSMLEAHKPFAKVLMVSSRARTKFRKWFTIRGS